MARTSRRNSVRPRSTGDDLSTLTPEELARRVQLAKSRDWLSVADLILLGIVNNKMTLHRLIKAGRFPEGVFVGSRSKRWLKSSIEEWQKRVVASKHVWDHASQTATSA